MKKNLGMFVGLSRWSVRAAWSAFFTFNTVCFLSISSAKADVTTFSDFDSSGNSTASSSDFSSASLTQSGGLQGPSTFGPSSGFGDSGTFLLYGQGSSTVNAGGFTMTLTASGNIQIADLYFYYNVSSGSATTAQFSYAINGGSSTPISDFPLFSTGSSWIYTVTGLNINLSGGQQIVFTETMNGATDSGAYIGFDNISLIAVPEPVNYALAGFGLIFIGSSVGLTVRRKLFAAKST